MTVTHCSVCHRLLTDPASIVMGIGPECRGKLAKRGWKFPKPRYQVRHGRVELVGMTGKVEKPMEAKDEKEELVKRVLKAGGTWREAAQALQEYMEEKDSHMSEAWCVQFVAKVKLEMKQ